jgi:hypothetical protein
MYGVLLQYFSTFFLNSLCAPLNHGVHCVCDTYLNIRKMNFAHILCVFVSCISYNSQHKHCYFSIRLWPVGFGNRNELCWLWGWNRSFTHYFAVPQTFFLWDALLFSKMWQDPNEWNTYVWLEEGVRTVHRAGCDRDLYCCIFVSVSIIVPFYFLKNLPLLSTLICVYVCRMQSQSYASSSCLWQLTEELLSSQEGLCSIELVKVKYLLGFHCFTVHFYSPLVFVPPNAPF